MITLVGAVMDFIGGLIRIALMLLIMAPAAVLILIALWFVATGHF